VPPPSRAAGRAQPAGPGSGAGAIQRGLLVALGAGLLVRCLPLWIPRIWFDEATTGLLGLSVLRGAFPVYFFGQPFMGALDGYLGAPIYYLLGPSPVALKLVALLFALLALGLTVRLAQDGFGGRAALFTAILLALPPDFLLAWSHEARNHYGLTLVLGALALLLALHVPARRSGSATVVYALLGGVLGLAFWTNFLSLAYWPAVAVLLARPGRRPLGPRLFAGVSAFVLGSLPHWLYGVPHGTALPPTGDRVGLADILQHLRALGRTAWPIIAGVPSTLRGSPPGALLAGGLAVLCLAAAAGALRARPRPGPPSRAVAMALTVLVVTNLALALGTDYGRQLDDNDPRYLLPLYTALPPLIGALLARLPPGSAVALTGALLLVHAGGSLRGSFAILDPRVAAVPRAEMAAQRETVAALDRAGLTRVYDADPGSRVLTFLSAERIICSHPYQEDLPEYARAVDGAPSAAWWVDGRSPVLEANFRALGAAFRFRPLVGATGVYVDFALAAPRVTELPVARLRVTTSDHPEAVALMTDRRASSLWSTGHPQRGGEWVQVDLGQLVPVALVRWFPGTFQEVPRGLRLDTSTDGVAWRTVVDLPEYLGPLYWSAGRPLARVRSGRVELRLAPTPARYLRLRQTGHDIHWPWTIRELYVYAAPAAGPAPPAAAPGTVLARALREAGVRRLYGDHGWTSRVALADPSIVVPPANWQLDDYGFLGLTADLLPPFRWEPGTGVVLEPDDAEGFEALARADGLPFVRRAVDGLALFAYVSEARPGRSLDRTTLSASASRHTQRARWALDGDPGTRWATAAPRAAGDWFRIDLHAPARVRAIWLEVGLPEDLPSAFVVEGSMDGTTWHRLQARPRPERRYRWGGFTAVPDGTVAVRLEFPPVALRALRLVLPAGDPVYDWSIHELAVETD
jgi:hypothetical protein